jgi:hypothetical protein
MNCGNSASPTAQRLRFVSPTVRPGIVAVPAGALVGDAAPVTTPKSRMSPTFMSGLLAVVTLDPDATQTSAAAGRRVGQGMPDPETDKSSATSAPRFEPDEGWVPADERLFGLDRRTIAPTLAVFALVIVMSVALPVVNAKVPYDDIVKAGDVIELEGDVTFVPEAGWGITSGVRAGNAPLSGEYPDTATVEDGAVKFTVHTAPFDGDANKLLDQIETTSEALNRGRGVHVTGAHSTIVTDQGKQGATARVTGPHTGGVIAAFVFEGRGVEAAATGPSDTGPEPTAAVFRMIRSISFPGEGKR